MKETMKSLEKRLEQSVEQIANIQTESLPKIIVDKTHEQNTKALKSQMEMYRKENDILKKTLNSVVSVKQMANPSKEIISEEDKIRIMKLNEQEEQFREERKQALIEGIGNTEWMKSLNEDTMKEISQILEENKVLVSKLLRANEQLRETSKEFLVNFDRE